MQSEKDINLGLIDSVRSFRDFSQLKKNLSLRKYVKFLCNIYLIQEACDPAQKPQNPLIPVFNQKASTFLHFIHLMLDQYYFSIDIRHSITFHFIYFPQLKASSGSLCKKCKMM